MNEIKINWIRTNYSDIDDSIDTPFYAFTRGGSLLYIGIAYKQIVKDEIKQTIKRLQITSTKGLSIWLGYVDINNSTYSRFNQQLVLDTECLMIYTNKPILNTQCKKSYTGRTNFKVKTSGCWLIRKCVRYERNPRTLIDKVYLTC